MFYCVYQHHQQLLQLPQSLKQIHAEVCEVFTVRESFTNAALSVHWTLELQLHHLLTKPGRLSLGFGSERFLILTEEKLCRNLCQIFMRIECVWLRRLVVFLNLNQVSDSEEPRPDSKIKLHFLKLKEQNQQTPQDWRQFLLRKLRLRLCLTVTMPT